MPSCSAVSIQPFNATDRLCRTGIGFSEGDFHDPAMIHGDEMPGLHTLITRHNEMTIVYSEIDRGGQIVYTADDPDLITAIHDWFDAQLSDHGHHSQDHTNNRKVPSAVTMGLL